MSPASMLSDLLRIWEDAAHHPPARRCFRLLAGISKNADAIAMLSVGERDRRLLLLRRELFGNEIESVTECPACRARVELRFTVSDLIASAAAPVTPAPVRVAGYEVHWRLPTCGDLAELAELTSSKQLRDSLVERCLTQVRHEHEDIAARDCPSRVVDDVCTAMAQADPCGDLRMDVGCSECQKIWTATFDVGAYLWREIDVWAKKLIRDVHSLAAAYGWSERDILAMSAARRRMYLDLVGA